MKKLRKFISFILVVAMMMAILPLNFISAFAVSTVWDGSVADGFARGTGTADDPYIIETAEQLAYLAESVNLYGNRYYNKYLRLDADIQLNDTTNWESWGTYNEQGNLIAPVNSWDPIGGGWSYYFGGTFNGNGHTVSGMYINGYVLKAGLFGYVVGCDITDLKVERSCIINMSSGFDSSTGGIVGYADDSSKISDCSNEGYITGNYYTGGVVGCANGTVANCYNTGAVTGSGNNGYTGGVVGHAGVTVESCYNTGAVTGNGSTGGVVGGAGVTVANCYNTGAVTGSGNNGSTGGVVGDSWGSLIYNCYNTGAVTGSGSYTGGVAGRSSRICECYNSGSIFGENYVGGISGEGWTESAADCYNTGSISGNDCPGIGGIVGNAWDYSILRCYNSGNIIFSGEDLSITGGIVGTSSGDVTVSDCYYLVDCIKNGNSYGIALSDLQMRSKDSFEGWNFNKTWEIGYSSDYPYPTLKCFGSKDYYYSVRFFDGDDLLFEDLVKVGDAITFSKEKDKETLDFDCWENSHTLYYADNTYTPEDDIDFHAIWATKNTSANVWDGSIDTDWDGEGTEEAPYLISSAAELAGLAQQTNSGETQNGSYFRQTCDIVLNDGGERFCDNIAGKNKWIPIGCEAYSFRGYYDGDDYTVSGMYIWGDLQYAGLFGCVSGGSISDLGVEGSYTYNYFSEFSYTGGVVGLANWDVVVTNCYNTGSVAGNGSNGNTGGVVGLASWDATVTNCYNTGAVTGGGDHGNTGGVVGGANATVTNCYNTGAVTGNESDGNTGGVVGLANWDVIVTNCYNTGTVTGGGDFGNTGGVVGDSCATVTNCYNTGAVTGSGNNGYTGGVVGRANATVTNCYNTGAVTGNESDGYTGGVVGYADGTVTNCYNTGAVTGSGGYNGHTGGVVGYANGTVTNCYNTGAVTGSGGYDGNTGGVVGGANATVTNCYNTGAVTGSGGYNGHTGGVVGSAANDSTVINCCYLAGCIENGNSYGTALSDLQMRSKDSFEGWNFYKNWEIGYSSDYPYPTLKCFGSKEYFYAIRFFDGEKCLESKLIKTGSSVILNDLKNNNGLEFSYWESDNTKLFAGEEITPEDDMDFYAIWTTKNISADVWDGSIDTEWDGEGTEEAPYLISSAAELAGLAQQANSRKIKDGSYFRQTCDIVLNDGGERFCDNIAGKNEWVPIGGIYNYEFKGYYDGCAHKVSGLYIKRNVKTAGLFGYINNGSISNLAVEDSYVYGECSFVGGVAGELYEASATACSYTGTASGGANNAYTGGVIGNISHYSVVTDCESSGCVTGETAGGIGGSLSYGSSVTNCSNKADISGNVAGGIVGVSSDYSPIEKCSNSGAVFGDNYSGGVSGYIQNGSISDCSNSGEITGNGKVGGIVSSNIGYSTVTNCYNTGSVTGSGKYADIGGVVGDADAAVTNCYNTGAVTGGGDYGKTGGVVGYADGTVTNCYNTGAVTGSGKYADIGGVVGDADAAVTNCYNTGSVTGGGDYGNTGGVVGDADAAVTNCYNTGSVTGSGNYTGGVVGRAGVTVESCYNTGAVTGSGNNGNTGGVVGGAYSNSTVANCYNTGAVTGNGNNTGGVVGDSYATVTNCYNTGAVTGNRWYTGGVVGYSSGTVAYCYYLDGCIVNPTNTFGTALTDKQMKQKESYIGFDFDEYWEIGAVEDYDYPTLQNVEHIITFMVTFLDKDGVVLKTQSVQKGYSAYPPYIESYGDGKYFYSFDHWDGSYTNVTEDRTLTAVYKQVEIIKFNDITIPFTVENGFSIDELRVQLESYFSRKLCTTTNGYKMMCEVVWNEDELNAYDPQTAGKYIISGILKITDPEYSQFADYYDMAEGAAVKVVVTVLAKNEQVVHFEKNDLKYNVLQDGSGVEIIGYSGSAPEIVIPEKINGYKVVAVADNAFADNAALTAVLIPSSVKSVGDSAFAGCSSLVQVSFESGIESIGEKAFYNTDLVSVTLPDSVVSIGEKAFGYYGDGATIEGFAVYCSDDSAAKGYADANGFNCVLLTEMADEETGVSVVAEENVTLVVAQVEEGSYYENAQQIVRENDNISLFEIKIVDEGENEVQPGNTMTVSVPLPDGFNPETCEVYRINPDGSYKAMNAKIVNGRLVFVTPHLSYYAIIEGGKIMRGDLDGDGAITVTDALMALRFAAKLATPTENDIRIADIDNDGNITVTDALSILRVAAKLTDAL